jgi:glyoxylase-like metal-dependent hydrolase (beta-lactamase superfamily II)
MVPLWGRVVPVPERNVRVIEGGETLTVGGREFDVEYTPGHASHHVVYFDSGDGTAYVGDVAGVRIPPADYVRAPTPPPDIDVDAWQRSIDLVAARQPARLALTHFGMVEDPVPHLAAMKHALDEQAHLVRELLERLGDTDAAVSAFVAEIERRTVEAVGEEGARMFEVGSPVEQRWLGLRRYWMKQGVAAAG